jgi:bifunctional non-homologous end joining protein LigD
MVVRKSLPAGFIVPAQPVERKQPPLGPQWVHEIKHDGFRMIVRRDGDRVRLYSRKAVDWTGRLPAIARCAAGLQAKSFTIDGEAVVIGPDGLTDFEALRRRGAGDRAVLYAFDLIEYDGQDLRALPIETRKATLASLLRKSRSILLCDHIAASGPDVFAQACQLGAEGIVSKRLGAPYKSGRCKSWVKVKNPAAIETQRLRSENWNK